MDGLYPEHEKLNKIKDQSQAIGEFLQWLTATREVELAEWVQPEYLAWDAYLEPTHRPFMDYLAEYFGIDQDKLEDEKRAMLDAIRGKQQ